MQFLDLSKHNVIMISLLILLLLGGVWLSLNVNEKFDFYDDATINLTYAKHSIFYSGYMLKKTWGEAENLNLALANTAGVFGSLAGHTPAAITNQTNKDTAVSVPVLAYHGVSDGASEDISTETFINHMTALKNDGWETITLEEFKDFIGGEKELSDKSFLLTFDDGIKTSYYPIDPVLKDLDYTAVMFIITKQALLREDGESNYYLSESELERMIDSGRWEIESHGRDDHEFIRIDRYGNAGHFLSSKKWDFDNGRLETDEEYRERIRNDLSNSKNDIKSFFGHEATTFAYPFGDFGQMSINFNDKATDIIIDEASKIYDYAFYQVFKSDGDSFNYPDKNTFMVKRIEPKASWSGEDLANKLVAGQAKELPYVISSFENDWVGTWGDMKLGNDMHLTASESSAGASALLDGSYWWWNYTFDVAGKLADDTSIVLMVRYKNDDNFVSCSFAGNRILIREQIDGNEITRAIANYAGGDMTGQDLIFSASANGSNVSCGVDHQAVVSAEIGNTLRHGGVGIYIWNRQQGQADADIYHVTVS